MSWTDRPLARKTHADPHCLQTDRLEQELEAGTTYFDCFRQINRRRTEIAMGVYSIQVISGIYLVGYAVGIEPRASHDVC